MSKPVVRYRSKPMEKLVVGWPAYVYPIDHPSDLVSNTKLIRTSPVVSIGPRLGEFETENTRYVHVETE